MNRVKRGLGKLLAKRKEIQALIEQNNRENTGAIRALTQSRYIKLRLAVGRGKKLYDKRD